MSKNTNSKGQKKKERPASNKATRGKNVNDKSMWGTIYRASPIGYIDQMIDTIDAVRSEGLAALGTVTGEYLKARGDNVKTDIANGTALATAIEGIAAAFANHPEWYSVVMRENVNNFQPGGLNFLSEKSGPIIKSNEYDANTFTGTAVSIPLAVSVDTMPVGKMSSDPSVDSWLQSCQLIYNDLLSRSGRVPTYSVDAVQKYIFALRNIVITIAEIIRGYEFSFYYSLFDRALPIEYGKALNVDIQDFKDNLASIRDFITQVLMANLKVFSIPDLNIFSQELWYYGNIFNDFEGAVGTYYIHRTTPTGDNPATWQEWKSKLNTQLKNLISSDGEDAAYNQQMIADITRVYGMGFHDKVVQLLHTRVVSPTPCPVIIRDAYQLSAVHNMNPVCYCGFQRDTSTNKYNFVITSGQLSVNAKGYGSLVVRNEFPVLEDLINGKLAVNTSVFAPVSRDGSYIVMCDDPNASNLSLESQISLCKSIQILEETTPDTDGCPRFHVTGAGSHVFMAVKALVITFVGNGTSRSWTTSLEEVPVAGAILYPYMRPGATSQEISIIKNCLSDISKIHAVRSAIDYCPVLQEIWAIDSNSGSDTDYAIATGAYPSYDYTRWATIDKTKLRSYHMLEVGGLFNTKLMNTPMNPKEAYNKSSGH